MPGPRDYETNDVEGAAGYEKYHYQAHYNDPGYDAYEAALDEDEYEEEDGSWDECNCGDYDCPACG